MQEHFIITEGIGLELHPDNVTNETLRLLKEAGITTHTMVGGAVLTLEYAQKAGADSYAPNGVEAVNLAKQVCCK